MGRRNISITIPEVDVALERADNISKFIERCVLEHLEREKVDYATKEDFKILNENYLELKKQIDGIVGSLFGLEE